jgi:hypothetical protein
MGDPRRGSSLQRFVVGIVKAWVISEEIVQTKIEDMGVTGDRKDLRDPRVLKGTKELGIKGEAEVRKDVVLTAGTGQVQASGGQPSMLWEKRGIE